MIFCPLCEGMYERTSSMPECQDTWHFWGWFFESRVPAMLQVARELNIPMRVGEQTMESYLKEK